MSRYAEQQEEVRCPYCGTLNLVTYRYSDFDPANQERETGRCDKCGTPIVTAKCIGIDTKQIDEEPLRRPPTTIL
jgi:DNA-directed RNA polymerase subunit RPC12/RpoP